MPVGSHLSIAVIWVFVHVPLCLCDSISLSMRYNQNGPSWYLMHQWILGQRSVLGLGLGDRTAGVSYAPLLSAALVYIKNDNGKQTQARIIRLVGRRKTEVNN